MFCKNCGQYIDDDSKFCKNCGTSQAVMASVGVINRTNNRSGVLEVPSTITVENFVSMLFAKGWIPNSAFVISSLKISPVKDESYIIYSGYGSCSENKETLLETLAEHDSDDIFIDYKEIQKIYIDDVYSRRREYLESRTCLYGCPNVDKAISEDEIKKENIEFAEKLFQLYYDL